MIFGRVGDAMIGIRARYALSFVPFDVSNDESNQDDMLKRGSVGDILTESYDLIQTGTGDHYIVTEMSSTDTETFNAFINRMMNNVLVYDETTHQVTYQSQLYLDQNLTTLDVNFQGVFMINQEVQDTNYPRFSSPYVMGGLTPRKPEMIRFSFGGYSLVLDFESRTRNLS